MEIKHLSDDLGFFIPTTATSSVQVAVEGAPALDGGFNGQNCNKGTTTQALHLPWHLKLADHAPSDAIE